MPSATLFRSYLCSLGQDGVRRLIVWLSVSQSGYALMAVCIVVLSTAALPALLFFLLGSAAANLAAFAVVVHLRGRTAIADYIGLGESRPSDRKSTRLNSSH